MQCKTPCLFSGSMFFCSRYAWAVFADTSEGKPAAVIAYSAKYFVWLCVTVLSIFFDTSEL